MKKYKETIVLGIILIGLSILLHGAHYMMFHDMHHIMVFLVADIAFIPLEVFFVSLVLEKVIDRKEKNQVNKKMQMLIGLFFTEVGNELLTQMVLSDTTVHKIRDKASVNVCWESKDFQKLGKVMEAHEHTVDNSKFDYNLLLDTLNPHGDMFVNLLSNPILHEHEAFSEVLMTVFHLHDELKTRLAKNPTKDDYDHLKIDAERAYNHLAAEWVIYMEHLKEAYPYLYATAIKHNPYTQVETETVSVSGSAS